MLLLFIAEDSLNLSRQIRFKSLTICGAVRVELEFPWQSRYRMYSRI